MQLIIIILNVVLLSFDDDILYKDDFTRSFYSHSASAVKEWPPHAAVAKTLFLHNGTVFPNKSHLILKYTRSRIYLYTVPQCILWSIFCTWINGLW